MKHLMFIIILWGSGMTMGFALAATLTWADHQVPLYPGSPGFRDFYQEDRDHQRQQQQERRDLLLEQFLRRPNPC